MDNSTSENYEKSKDLSVLLDQLCVELGFCLPPKEKNRILEKTYFDAPSFSREVLISEGMNPEEHEALRRQVMRYFTDRYGNSNH